MLVTGFPYDVHSRVDEIVGLFGAFVGQVRAVRRLGSAAIDLCYVAAGRLDGFWESDLKAWDIAGGALIVAEAAAGHEHGGRAVHVTRGHALATNGHLHAPMLDVIVKFRQERSSSGRSDIRERQSRPGLGDFRGYCPNLLAPLLLRISGKGARACFV